MTQEATPVGGEATPAAETNAADVFTKLAEETFGVTDDEQEPAEGEDETPAEGADDEPTLEEEADDLPPIEAPVSLTAEEKEAFKNLPREAQEFTARRIGDLEKGFNQKAQEAARAKQDAEQAAQQQLAQYDAQVAQTLQSYAQQIMPQEPDPAMLQYDQQGFYAQRSKYESAIAQQRELQQQAQGFAQQAQQRAAHIEQAAMAEQHRVIVEQFPEYADPTTGPELQRKLSAVAKRIGYSDELISQARASDIIAMRNVADAIDKADKYDALMSKKMANVRAAKGLPKVATPGVAQGSDQLRARTAQAALEVAKSSNNREAKGAAFFDYLSKSGQI